MSTVLQRPGAGSSRIPSGLNRGLSLANSDSVVSPSGYRARLSYIAAALVISAMLTTWGMSLVALGANNTQDARVFAAALVLFGVISSVLCVVILFRVSWEGYKSEFRQRVAEQEQSRAATIEVSAWVEALNSLYSDEKLGHDIARRLREAALIQLSASETTDRLLAEEIMRAVNQRIREQNETLGQLLAS